MKTMTVKAKRFPSTYKVEDGDHVCVYYKYKDKTYAWKNHGRGPEDRGGRVFIECDVYIEWLHNLCEPAPDPKIGIEFPTNGVCQTYASRELLVSKEKADLGEARRNHTIVAIFGKYGYGLEDLDKRLRNAHKKLPHGSQDSLETALHRLHNAEKDELLSWMKFLEKRIGMPVDKIVRKGGEALKKEAMERQKKLIKNREIIYKNYAKKGTKKVHTEIFKLLKEHCTSGMKALRENNYITENEYIEYLGKLAKEAGKFFKVTYRQYMTLQATGTYEGRAENLSIEDSWIDDWDYNWA